MRSREGVKTNIVQNIETLKRDAQGKADSHFKDYNEATDKKIFAEMIKLYYENVPKEFHPAYFANFEKITAKSANKYQAFADYCFSKSVFVNKDKFNKFLSELSPKSYNVLMKDPVYLLMKDLLVFIKLS
jgi:hypothetical protein